MPFWKGNHVATRSRGSGGVLLTAAPFVCRVAAKAFAVSVPRSHPDDDESAVAGHSPANRRRWDRQARESRRGVLPLLVTIR